MDIKKLNPLSYEMLEELGLSWHTDSSNADDANYISDELITITQSEADGFYDAANELYDMYVEAAQYVIDNDLFFELDIPPVLVDMIKQSFDSEVCWHLYGRFDFAGGIDGKPIKLLEFNADTPTMVYETSVISHALLRANGLGDEISFNNFYDAMIDNFKRLVVLDNDVSNFHNIYEGWKILFSAIKGSNEDFITTKYLQNIATNAGFNTEFAFIDEVDFDSSGVYYDNLNYEYMFKLVPWEDIAILEGDLALIMKSMMNNKNTIFLNPPYTLLFQSKMMLKILWDLYPNHPLLLETSTTPLIGKSYVEKRSFGREGANVRIFDNANKIIAQNGGIYDNHKIIYQEFSPLNSSGAIYYQPSVFYAYEACALGFRRGPMIMDNMSKFVTHIIKDRN